MLLQAGAARRALARDGNGNGDLSTPSSRELLESMETVGRDAFRDLDVALGLVDAGDEPLARGLATVPHLVEELRKGGLDVELIIEMNAAPQLSKLVDWSAFRIVQEALTNVTRHAPDARTCVTLRFERDEVCVSIINDGDGNSDRVAASNARVNGHRVGRGLIGMRERVSVLGGGIEIGPDRDGGFAVVARLPT
jgi:signal transduction histidine kinase